MILFIALVALALLLGALPLALACHALERRTEVLLRYILDKPRR